MYRLRLTDDAVVGDLPTGNRLYFEVSHLKELLFLVRTKADPDDGRVLIYCTVTHDKPFTADGVSDTTVLVRATRSMGGLPAETERQEETT